VCCRGRAVAIAKNFIQLEVKNISRRIQEVANMKFTAQSDKNPAHTPKHTGAFKAKILAVTNSGTGMFENPAKQKSTQGAPAQGDINGCFALGTKLLF